MKIIRDSRMDTGEIGVKMLTSDRDALDKVYLPEWTLDGAKKRIIRQNITDFTIEDGAFVLELSEHNLTISDGKVYLDGRGIYIPEPR